MHWLPVRAAPRSAANGRDRDLLGVGEAFAEVRLRMTVPSPLRYAQRPQGGVALPSGRASQRLGGLLYHHSVHDAAVAVIVVGGIVPSLAIVPEGKRVRLPPKSAPEFGKQRVLVKLVEQRLAFLVRLADEAVGIGRVHEKDL